MTKKIAHITMGSEYAKIQNQQLEFLFKDHIQINSYSYDKDIIDENIKADLVLTSIPDLYHRTIKHIPKKSKVIITNTTITKHAYDLIKELPSEATVLVVNDTFLSTMETINLFHVLGLDHLTYVPYYPGAKNFPELTIAITPAETAIVPKTITRIIDIGHRLIDADTLTEIAINLKLEDLLSQNYFVEYLKTIKIVQNNLTSQFNNTSALESQVLNILNMVDDGIIIIDSQGIIKTYNEKALSIINTPHTLINSKITEVIPEINHVDITKSAHLSEGKLIKHDNHYVSMKVAPTKNISGNTNNTVITINNFNKKEKTQYKLRTQLIEENYPAKYEFKDIITENSSLIQIKTLAKKQALSDFTVLITGESGTGKELFAQAIHNASKRRHYPFIAINCAALPESLLESELFGYEGGAFTGAKKGGKLGYFELAHKGTIFLDEIGEMEPTLQSRLLRVIEEREILRIGGNKVIPIDIKIISASNKNLWSLVEDKKFREDLFYRLHVLPINLSPLRERKKDISLLFKHFQKELNIVFSLTSEAKEVLNNYPWYGNIRELRNCIKYLSTLDKSIIDDLDLLNILRYNKRVPHISNEFEKELSIFMNETKFERENYCFVLKTLYESYRNRTRIGRRSILELSKNTDIFLTEAQIRRILKTLELHKFVYLSNGGGGTTITPLGIKAFMGLNSNEFMNDDRILC